MTYVKTQRLFSDEEGRIFSQQQEMKNTFQDKNYERKKEDIKSLLIERNENKK